MSIDRSLKTAGNLSKHRNVLTRAERIEKLLSDEKFSMDEGNPIGLPKVANRKVATGGKTPKKEEEEAAVEVEGAVTPEPAES